MYFQKGIMILKKNFRENPQIHKKYDAHPFQNHHPFSRREIQMPQFFFDKTRLYFITQGEMRDVL